MNPFAGLTNEAVFAFLVCSKGSMESIQKARPKKHRPKERCRVLEGSFAP